MTNTSLLESIGVGVERFFEPLVVAATNTPEGREQLDSIFSAIDVDLEADDVETVQGGLESFASAYVAFVALATDDGEADEATRALVDLLSDAQSVFDSLEDLESALSEVEVDAVVPRLLDHLAVRYVQREYPRAYFLASLLTVVSIEQPPEPEESRPFEDDLRPYTAATAGEASLDLEQVADLLDSPVETLRDSYLPDGPLSESEFRVLESRVVPWLVVAAGEVGLRVEVSDEPAVLAEPYARDDVMLSRVLSLSYRISASTTLSIRLALASTDDGLALFFGSRGGTSADADVGDWQFAFGLTGEAAPSLLSPDGLDPLGPDGTASLTATTGLEKRTDPDTGSAYVVGEEDGTRLEVGRLGLEGSVTATESTVETDVVGYANDSAFVLDAGDGDGFIQHVLPEDGLDVGFDAGLGWSNTRGLYVEGGTGGLDADLPLHLSIGEVLTVETLRLAAKPDDDAETITVPVQISASPQVSLGPVDATVEDIGLEAEIAFPEANDGNLGPLDVTLGFKPPSGAGLAIDAGVVVGGGHLTFEPEEQRYSGTLQLTVGDLTLTAVGLLTTKLPDGRSGFSLLLIVTGEFPPVQLGFGFTLNAVGGLLGVNRTMEVDVLRSGLRDGTTKSVLFPEDPVRNAPQIVSDLRNVFPPANAQHVFGPMARLGWGTPTILTADIGVLLELPEPVRLVILGRLHAALPDEDAALVVFNMDAIGVVDFDEKEGSIDATLYDSRVLAFTLSGDMAMRTNWGDDPDFVLAVGGFNPRYEPPDGFPDLRRIALSLGSGNPTLRCEAYFAITSNTAQFGAGVELYAEAGKFSVDGHMGFDALFYFDPFEFVIDFAAGFAVKRGSRSLLTVDLSGTLAGPTPWHVHGDASFKIGFVSFSVSVDRSFGDDDQPPSLPPADVLGKLEEALEDERNWAAQLPEGGDSIVTLRDVEAEGGTVLAHPLGRVEVRQTIVPLGLEIDTFGNAKPETYDTFEIDAVTVDDDSPDSALDTEALTEKFAPAAYVEMSEEDKLDGPSFEAYEAGRRIVTEAVGYGGAEDDLDDPDADRVRSEADLLYETDIVDESAGQPLLEWKELVMPASTAKALSSCSAVARCPRRTTGAAKYDVPEDERDPTGIDGAISIDDVNYVIVTNRALEPVTVDGAPTEPTTKYEAKRALEHLEDDGAVEAGTCRVVCAHEAAREVTT